MSAIEVKDKYFFLLAVRCAEGDGLGGAVGNRLDESLAKVHGAIDQVDLDDTVAMANRETIRMRVEGEPSYLSRLGKLVAKMFLEVGRPLFDPSAVKTPPMGKILTLRCRHRTM
jgi:hypothetical protein